MRVKRERTERTSAPRTARRPRLGDVLTALGLTAVQFLSWLSHGDPAWGPELVPFLLLCANTMALALRASHPRTSFLCAAPGMLLLGALLPLPAGAGALTPVVMALALYSLARHTPAATSLAGLVCVCAALLFVLLLDFLTGPGQWGTPLFRLLLDTVVLVAFPVVLWLLGHSHQRVRRDTEQLRALTEQLRAERELSTRRALVAERIRIAHDLHDIVANHISGIAVVAHAGIDGPADDPQEARGGMEAIADTADAALLDMRRLLGLLSVGDAGPGLVPEASLDQLGPLASAARSAGCTVLIDTEGPFGDLPASLTSTAHRVVQEGLANVTKHAAPSNVTVRSLRRPDDLVVEVVNGPSVGPGRRPGGSGLGLAGLRERVGVFSGELTAAPDRDGGWLLRAAFPLDGTEAR